MVEECCKFVDQTPDLQTKLKLIDTLRTISEGKVYIMCLVQRHMYWYVCRGHIGK